MRHIVKQAPFPKLFQTLGVNEYQHLHSENRQAIRTLLLIEQFYLCAYCEKQIDEASSHNEHIKPQSSFPAQSLEYDNLVASCNHGTGDEASCGHRKQHWYNKDQFIHPLLETCRNHFRYDADGSIKGLTDAGTVTIEKLSLNNDRLREHRRNVLKQYEGWVDQKHINCQIETGHYPEYISAIEDVWFTP
jgi:uncharacterized protein (TIGR02646 family)